MSDKPDAPYMTNTIERENGAVHVQHFGPEHEVPGSDQYFEVPPGCSIVVRHPHGAVRILHIGDRA